MTTMTKQEHTSIIVWVTIAVLLAVATFVGLEIVVALYRLWVMR